MLCAQKSNKSLSRQGSGSLWPSRPFSHLESGHAVPFSPQDFCSLCEFVHCCHNTRIPRARIHITRARQGVFKRPFVNSSDYIIKIETHA